MSIEYLVLFVVVGLGIFALIDRIEEAMRSSYLLESTLLSLPIG